MTLSLQEWAELFHAHHQVLYPVQDTPDLPSHVFARALARADAVHADLLPRITEAQEGRAASPTVGSMTTALNVVQTALNRYTHLWEDATFNPTPSLDSIVTELTHLQNSDWVLDLSFDHEAIKVTFDCEPDGCPLGPYTLIFSVLLCRRVSRYRDYLKIFRAPGNFYEDRVAFAELVQLRRRTFPDPDYQPIRLTRRVHPHCGYPGPNDPCMGEAGPLFTTSLRFGRLYDLVHCMYRMLNTFNQHGDIPDLSVFHPLWHDRELCFFTELEHRTPPLGYCPETGTPITPETVAYCPLLGDPPPAVPPMYHRDACQLITCVGALRVFRRLRPDINPDYLEGNYFYHPRSRSIKIGPYWYPKHDAFCFNCHNPNCRAWLLQGVRTCPRCDHVVEHPAPDPIPAPTHTWEQATEPAPDPGPTPANTYTLGELETNLRNFRQAILDHFAVATPQTGPRPTPPPPTPTPTPTVTEPQETEDETTRDAIELFRAFLENRPGPV